MNLPAPTITYAYDWPFGEGPVGTMVDRGRADDSRKASITDLQIVEFPDDSPTGIHAYGVPMTSDGGRDRRFNRSTLCWVDNDALIAAHNTLIHGGNPCVPTT